MGEVETICKDIKMLADELECNAGNPFTKKMVIRIKEANLSTAFMFFGENDMYPRLKKEEVLMLLESLLTLSSSIQLAINKCLGKENGMFNSETHLKRDIDTLKDFLGSILFVMNFSMLEYTHFLMSGVMPMSQVNLILFQNNYKLTDEEFENLKANDVIKVLKNGKFKWCIETKMLNCLLQTRMKFKTQNGNSQAGNYKIITRIFVDKNNRPVAETVRNSAFTPQDETLLNIYLTNKTSNLT